MARIKVALALAALLAVAGCSGSDSAGEMAVEAEDQAALVGGGEGDDAVEEAAPGAAEAGVGDELAPLPDPSAAQDLVIKDGTITLAVGAGEFDAAYARIVAVADRLGGTVASSTTRTQSDGGGASGSVTVRVPAQEYEDLLVAVAEIGMVRSRDVTASDVSAEYVDLQARQRNLEAQERFYLGLLERAEGVPDAIAIQQQLTSVTEQLEQVKGRIAFLDDRTSFSTLTVELFEPGATLPLTEDPAGTPSFAEFWQLAQDAFVNVIGWTMVAISFFAPLALIGLAVLALWRLTPRRPRPEPSRPEPEPEREREPVG